MSYSYTVRTRHGIVARTSKSRVYTHVVTSTNRTVAYHLDEADRRVKMERANLTYLTGRLALVDAGKGDGYDSRLRLVKDIARIEEILDSLSTPEGRQAYAEAEAAKIFNHGFCGSLDLARKTAQRIRTHGFQNVTITAVAGNQEVK
jgi:hypothetical protein